MEDYASLFKYDFNTLLKLLDNFFEYLLDPSRHESGLFRVPASNEIIIRLGNRLRLGTNINVNEYKPHAIASVIKILLREFTSDDPYDLFKLFIQSTTNNNNNGNNNDTKPVDSNNTPVKTKRNSFGNNSTVTTDAVIKALIENSPERFLVFAKTCLFINQMTTDTVVQTTRMSVNNFAIVFAPNLFLKTGLTSIQEILQVNQTYNIMEDFITNAKKIFGFEKYEDTKDLVWPQHYNYLSLYSQSKIVNLYCVATFFPEKFQLPDEIAPLIAEQLFYTLANQV